MRDYKIKSDGSVQDVDLKKRIVTGYASKFGNIDLHNDMIVPGAFKKTLKERGVDGNNSIWFLHNHKTENPLGKPRVLKEDSFGLYFEAPIVDTTIGSDVLKLYEEGLINEHSIGFSTIKENKVTKSFNDYPKSVSDNAKKGIRLNEEGGNKCATDVGKIRAQQLANNENISLDVVKRMYSYLSRAKTYYNPDDETACGTISYLLWGGLPALKWSEDKIKEVESEKSANGTKSYYEIQEVKLFEFSSVLWGANPDTPFLGLKSLDNSQLVDRFDKLYKQLKGGTVSDETMQLLEIEYNFIKTQIAQLINEDEEVVGDDTSEVIDAIDEQLFIEEQKKYFINQLKNSFK